MVLENGSGNWRINRINRWNGKRLEMLIKKIDLFVWIVDKIYFK